MISSILQQFVEAIERQRSRWSEPLQPPASEEQVVRLLAMTTERLETELIVEYIDLLRVTNGIDENGLEVYATHTVRNIASDVIGRELMVDGFVEKNLELRGDYQHFVDFLVFASTTLYFHGMDLSTGKYWVLPKDSKTPSRVFSTFEELMIDAIGIVLQPEFKPQ